MDRLEDVKLEGDTRSQLPPASRPCSWVLKKGAHSGKTCHEVYGFKAYGAKPYCSNHMKGYVEEEVKESLPTTSGSDFVPPEEPPPEKPDLPESEEDPFVFQFYLKGRKVTVTVE